jgi:hypothetical protein
MAAWSLAGFTMLMLVAALVLAGLDASRMGVARIVFYGILGLAVVVYAGAGCLIVGRVPQRRRLAAVPYRAVAGGQRADGAICAVRAGHGAGVAARGPLGGWFSGTLAALAVALLFFLVVLFPDGQAWTRSTRWLAAGIYGA